jgi:hypothetical protein
MTTGAYRITNPSGRDTERSICAHSAELVGEQIDGSIALLMV